MITSAIKSAQLPVIVTLFLAATPVFAFIPASGVDTRAYAANQYHGYDDGYGETAVTYSGTHNSRSGSDTKTTFGNDPNQTFTFVDHYYAEASLYNGTLHARAVGSSITQGQNTYKSLARASASFQDTLFFSPAPDPLGRGFFPVYGKVHLDGTLTSNADGSSQQYVGLNLRYSSFSSADSPSYSGYVQYMYNVYGVNTQITSSFVDLGNNDFGFQMLVPDTGLRGLTFLLGLSVNGNGGTADYSNTAALSIDAPSDVQYTSLSRVFLTGSSSAVPEPDTWTMMIFGFFGIGFALRRNSLIRN